ncbi:putative ATG8/AUT7/APG8/PAZ2 [Leishmania mexicana MHOM/GT/2001/U1103]|uniref:Autophagy-related protein n=1 Tax=Leishmania mexicana (strain MHOM/GT/2001/U1103) TaxID=929439 RepID=E9AS40_LEIMU|nr:putative ATG8/AUT7/APG8/PAZ2 [Leishmania mexicana MHOM/GT/2001/U1103]CBZ25761.1 putative ATG8/AUT7/APG8/PAZ2 [Leishmania mexicana MHOM/GT/2001/U1103]
MSMYQSLIPADARRAECERVCREHPEQLPVVVESANSSHVRFLAVPRDATVADLEAEVRQTLGTANKKVALAIEGSSPASTTVLGDIFDAFKQVDGFLYVSCTRESAMGARDICCFGNTGKYFADIENNPNLLGSL